MLLKDLLQHLAKMSTAQCIMYCDYALLCFETRCCSRTHLLPMLKRMCVNTYCVSLDHLSFHGREQRDTPSRNHVAIKQCQFLGRPNVINREMEIVLCLQTMICLHTTLSPKEYQAGTQQQPAIICRLYWSFSIYLEKLHKHRRTS